MKIRPLKKSEIKKVTDIVTENYSSKATPYAEYEISGMFKNKVKSPKFLVAEEKGKIIGFVGYGQSWINFRIYEIFLVNVALKYQNKGIGSVLMNKIIKEIKSKRGKNHKAFMILLTTSKQSSSYYSKRFRFRTIMRFREKKAHLMALNLE